MPRLSCGQYRSWVFTSVLLLAVIVGLHIWGGLNERLGQHVVIFVITPTVARPQQKADLTRLSYTFRLVQNLVWIVVEDTTDAPSGMVNRVLQRSGVRFVHLTERSPVFLHKNHPKGMAQRNRGLRWLRENASRLCSEGVVFFADDDNTYDVRLFDLMRGIRVIGVWPVAFVGALMLEKPTLNGSSVIGWEVSYGGRKFPVDMAGFAVSLKLLLHPAHSNVEFDEQTHFTRSESYFLELLGVQTSELEPLGMDWHEVLVWHTKSNNPRLTSEPWFKKKYRVKPAEGWEV